MIRLALIAALMSAPALAHDWYDAMCCSSRDCAPIPDPEWTPDGWRVRLMPGQHPMVTEQLDAIVPFDAVRPSQDGGYHACVVPYQRDRVRCLYVPGSV